MDIKRTSQREFGTASISLKRGTAPKSGMLPNAHVKEKFLPKCGAL